MDAERVGVLLPQDAAADFPGAFQVRLRGRVIAQGPIGVADGQPDLRLDPRLLRELAGDAGGRTPQHFLHRHLLVAGVLVRRRLGQEVIRGGSR